MDKTFTFFKQQNINLKLFWVLVIVILFLTKTYGQDTWVRKADFAGAARTQGIGFSIGSKGYVGLGNGSKQYKDFWEYDPITNVWTQKADYAGNGRYEAVGFNIGNKGYVGTGDSSSYSGHNLFNDFYEYDPSLNTWAKKADYPGGKVWFAVGFGIGNKGYIGTGLTTDSLTKDFWEYDPLKDNWTRKADFGGEARLGASAFFIGSKGYVGTGNISAVYNTLVKDFWEYDPSTDKWTRKADFGNVGTADAVGFSIGNKGYIGTGTSSGSTYSFYEYDPSINKWVAKANFGGNKNRDNAVAFSVGGKGYVGTGHFGATFKDFYEYTPCGDKNFSAAFDFVQNNYQVNFSTTKVPGLNYTWDFGDGTKDTATTVLHTYNNFANYSVKLIVSNVCYADTVTKNVVVKGLKEIVNNHGGNTGIVTATIIGAGFTKIYLNRSGQQIQGQNLTIQADGTVTAIFDLTKQALGLWDVVAVFPDNTTVTLPNAYTVENGNAPKLSVELTGSSVLRIGFNQIYTINYSNAGNTDVKLVPLYIGGLPLGTEIEIVQAAYDISQVPGFDTLKNSLFRMPKIINDSVNKISFRTLLLRKINANSTGTLNVIFHLPAETQLHTTPSIICALGYPYSLYGSDGVKVKTNGVGGTGTSQTAEQQADAVFDCKKDAARLVFDKLLEQLLKKANIFNLPKEYEDCGVSFASDKLFDRFAGEDVVNDYLDMGHFVYGYIDQRLGCAAGITSTVGGVSGAALQFQVALPAFLVTETIMAASEFLAPIGAGIDLAKLIKDCNKGYDPMAKLQSPVIVGNAVDPNELYGSGDASVGHFTNKQTLLNYTVGFENKPEANLNAQTVNVIDTLKKDYFNLNTFGFTSVVIGDSTLNFSSPVKSFIHDFDFTSKYSVKARVVASFDTISGIAKWKFYTIDPATSQVTNKALDGFLPPDVKSPEGQGYVSYQISPKAGLGTGDMIQNKAYITFDYNPVIPTNAWNNTFDFVAPVSKIEPLATTTADSTFVVHWGGSDNLSGIARYNILYAVGNGPFQTWLNGTSATSAKFTGQKDSTYKFYSIAMDNAGNTEAVKTSAEASITVKVPKNQIIKIPQITSKTYGDADFDPGATASSALPVTYATNNPAVATLVNGKLHIAGAGIVIITASQAGNQDYTAATPVSDTLLIKKATQILTFPTILTKNYNDPDFNLGATSSSGLPVTYTSSNPAVLTLVNGQLHIAATGTSTITATQAGNANYLAAASISQDIQVIFALPANNFTTSAISVSCKGSSNGEINIVAASTQNYMATVTLGTTSTTYPFTGQLSVKNLPAGTYSVCVTIPAYPAYKQCFDVVVTEPKDLSVYSVVNPTLGTLSLNLSGASLYNITVNGTVYTTTQSNITLPLEPGSNTVKVTTASICQGIYEKTIQLPPGVLAYPNPFEKTLSLSIGNDRSSTATIEVYDIKGQKVYAGKSSINQGKCSLDLGSLAPGSYMLKLVLDHSETHLKIIKK